MPNITGTITDAGKDGKVDWGTVSGVFYASNSSTATNSTENAGSFTSTTNKVLHFDASRSNKTYGSSTTVQPSSIKVRVKTRYA